MFVFTVLKLSPVAMVPDSGLWRLDGYLQWRIYVPHAAPMQLEERKSKLKSVNNMSVIYSANQWWSKQSAGKKGVAAPLPLTNP